MIKGNCLDKLCFYNYPVVTTKSDNNNNNIYIYIYHIIMIIIPIVVKYLLSISEILYLIKLFLNKIVKVIYIYIYIHQYNNII